jgi:hypothetical protein
MDQNQFMNQAIRGVLTMYKGMVFPYLKYRRGSIISASILVWLVFKLDGIFRPPKNIRHIPYFGMFGMLCSVIKGERYTDSALRTSLPEINSRESNGIYIVRHI